ncbi:MAG: transcriptional regulator TrmB [Parcubacteria group bacterium Gr01-1014_30]|nr:MAG: transcriptional regulator TrmB [Parcubacteria group bacterium Gr01-1014_30]
MLVKHLLEFGLSEKEARVYLALLELGMAAVSEIAKTANVNRSTVYVVLESLKKKGLAGQSPDKPIVQYFASSPDLLLHSASVRAKREEEVRDNLKQILPEVKALHKDTRHRPKVRVYEGREGIAEVFLDAFDDNDPPIFKVCANPVQMAKYIPNFIEENEKRVSRGIKMHAINPASKEVIEFSKAHPLPKGDEIRVIPKEKFNFPANIATRGSKVSIISMKGDFGLVIENKEITESFSNIFDLAWEMAKMYDKKLRGSI